MSLSTEFIVFLVLYSMIIAFAILYIISELIKIQKKIQQSNNRERHLIKLLLAVSKIDLNEETAKIIRNSVWLTYYIDDELRNSIREKLQGGEGNGE